jgi:hypothetical protein
VHVFGARLVGAATLGNAVLLSTLKSAADEGRTGAHCRDRKLPRLRID